MALTFCGVLFIALWGLYRVTNLQDLQGMDKDQMDDAIHQAMELEVEFQNQISSWKNLLLRGTDPSMFSQYRQDFESAEAKIQIGLRELLGSAHFIQFPAENLRLLIKEHRQEGSHFRELINSLQSSNPASFAQADKDAFDFGRVTSQRFDLFIENMNLHVLKLENQSKSQMEAVARQVSLFSLCSVAFGILLSAVFIVDRSRKEKALYHSKTAAENANRAKDAFLANISHEIRTPMNAIVGLSEVLSDTQLTKDQEEYVSTIRQSGSDLLGIINEILDLSKMEAGKIEIRPVTFQLRDCVEDAAGIIAPKASKKNLEFSIQLDPDLPIHITADEMRVRQILINLLGNAVKFTDKGRIDLKLEGRYDDKNEYILSIHVSDTGGGIKKEDQEKLFEAFSQVDDSNARRFGGTGLGLTISRDFSRLMGGDISVNSVYGEGTTFTVTIKPDSVSKEVMRTEAVDLSAIEGKSIAVVDASDFNRKEMVKFLRRWGAEARSWNSAAGFLEDLERGSLWNLAILGTNIRDIPVDEFAHQLRQTCGNQVNAILKWAPYEGLRIEAKPPDFNGLVYKPIQTRPLIQKVTAVLTDKTLDDNLRIRSSAELKAKMGILRPMKMLIVDDNRVNLRVAELILKNHGYSPTLAQSGSEALEILKEERFDVIFMDMQMPVMDGLEASRRIRQKFESPDRPWIIALTANAMSDHRDLCMEAGMNDFLPKPVKSEAIQRIIQNVPLDISRPPFQVKKRKLFL
jgi:signal transduction histidine kinase/CheY-like chemotaxis protein